MNEEYNCYSYAKELGFTEEEALALQASKCGKGQDATTLRRLATAKRLPSMKPTYPMPEPLQPQSSPVPFTLSSKPPEKRKRKPGVKPKK